MPNKLDNLSIINKEIERIRKEIDDLYKEIYWLDRKREKFIKIKESPTALQKAAFGRIAAQLWDETQKELIKNAELALSKSPEFSGLGSWHGGLISACSDIMTVTYYGDTASNLRVEIDLNYTAGTIEEYGNAVKVAREKVSTGKKSPKIASTFWKNWIYMPAREGKSTPTRYRKVKAEVVTRNEEWWKQKYWDTMNLRKEAFQSRAPWWELLDKGSMGVEMPSDWGGTPYPVGSPTHFVTDTILFAEKRAKELGKGYIKRYRDEIEDTIVDYSRAIRRDTIWVRDLEEQLAKLIEQLEPVKIITKLIQKQVKKQEERKGKMADPEKIMILAQDIVNNVPVGRRRLGGDIRIRLVRIIKKFEMELSKRSGE